jgi:hypothetical protein
MGTAGKQRKTAAGRGKRAPAKLAGKRYSPQAQQEDRSEGQFRDRMAETGVGWSVNRMGRDLGEDLVVQVYDQGASTGLSFYVQLKSVADAERKKPKRGPEVLRYRLEVKDLRHWEVQTTLVVLVVWDVEKREGYWQTTPRIVAELDKTNEGWRDKKSVTVSLPVEQGTDDGGLKRLRWAVAERMMPLAADKSPMRLTFREPELWNAFEHALDRGEHVVFEKDFMPEIERPAWHRRLYGATRTMRLELRPIPPGLVLPVRIEAWTRDGSAALPYVELRATKHGRKHMTLSNEHQGLPIVCMVSIAEPDGGTIVLRQTRFGNTVQEAREAAAFLLAMHRVGSRIRVVDLKTGNVLLNRPMPPSADDAVEGIEVLHATLEKLAFLEPKLAAFGSVKLEHGITHDEAIAIDTLYKICRDGQFRQHISTSFDVSPDAGEMPINKPVSFVSKTKLKLLGLEIPLGRVRETVVDPSLFHQTAQEAAAKAKASGTPTRVDFDNLLVDIEFLDWPHPRARIHDLAASQSGYFTLVQAAGSRTLARSRPCHPRRRSHPARPSR